MPRIKSNVHTHTTFCDGSATPEQMTEAALALGMHTLGFSCHSFTPFDTSCCVRDYGAYSRDIERLKARYAGRIELLCGVEADLFGEVPKRCDFVIGSMHYIREGDAYYPVDDGADKFADMIDRVFCGDAYAAAEAFYAQMPLLAATRPDIYGHFDLFTRYNLGNAFFDEGSARYRRAALNAADCLPRGALVEVNLGRLFKGEGGIYPSQWLLRELNERGCRFILSSDAHCPAALGYAFDEVCTLLKGIGVKSLVQYRGRVVEEVEL